MDSIDEYKILIDKTLQCFYSIDPQYSEILFYGNVLSNIIIGYDENMEFAAGVYFKESRFYMDINPIMFCKFKLEHRIGIIIHECLHVINKHLGFDGRNREDFNHKIYNYACDCAINQLIPKKYTFDSMIFPNNISDKIIFPYNLSAENYYNLLMDTLSTEDTDNMKDIEHVWVKDDESEIPNEILKDISEKFIEDILEKYIDNLPKGLSSLILLKNNKKINKIKWYKLIKKLKKEERDDESKTSSSKRRNRRNPHDLTLKGKIKDFKVNNIVAVLDTSGSMTSNDINKGLQEINWLCKYFNYDLKIVQVDTEVHEVKKYKPSNTFTRRGNGGTYIYPAIEYIINNIKHELIIIITDGHIEDINGWKKIPSKLCVILTTDKIVNTPHNYNNFECLKL